MTTEKRARKRTAREERLEAMRKQRNNRLIGVGAVLLIVIGLAIFASTGNDGEEGGDGENIAAESTDEAAAACDAEAPEAADPKQYEAAPKMQLEEGVDYRATITTSCGEIALDLFEEEAPETVNNFVFLAQEGYFDGLIWHRVERNFVIQAGDPDGNNGQPPDGPGYNISDELWAKSNDYIWGTVAMANSSAPNTGGSQFFIIVHEPRDKPAGLQPLYSVFGTVDEASYETLTAIASAEVPGTGDPSVASKPIVPVYIEAIEITES